MTRGNLRHHLEDYYGREAPREETVSRLIRLARADTEGEVSFGPAMRRTWWSPQITVMAASIALILSVISLYEVSARSGGDAGPARIRTTLPDLVAVKFQVDGCPKAAAAEPLFTELIDEYADKPVLFARYDMTNDANRLLSAKWAHCLGIGQACQPNAQSGTILLIDRSKCKILAKLHDRKEFPQMVAALNSRLH